MSCAVGTCFTHANVLRPMLSASVAESKQGLLGFDSEVSALRCVLDVGAQLCGA